MLQAIKQKLGNKLLQNSLWGVVSNILQNILFSVFFIVLAREYSTSDFANYVIANTIYGFVLGFSTLGLGHWFIRELMHTEDKKNLIDRFFKIQLYSGLVFYAVNVAMAFLLYQDSLVRNLAILIGINILFDNIIFVIKYINIARLEQKKTFVILTIEAFLKFLLACTLFLYPIPVIYLSLFLIALRLITLNLFIRFGSSGDISLKSILRVSVPVKEIRELLKKNWSFIIIGSVSVIFWRIGSLIVSKKLDLNAVADYEISFKLFSIAYLLPVIVASTVYPMLLNAYKNSISDMRALYQRVFLAFTLYGLLAYTFVLAYAEHLVPWLFGDKYLHTHVYCEEMFLSILVFPTLFLQANVMITLKLEKLDMLCNLISLALNISLSLIGLMYLQSLSVINYAIFFSFIAFHMIQDWVLYKKTVSGFNEIILYYGGSLGLVFLFRFLSAWMPKEYLYAPFWLGLLIPAWLLLRKTQFWKGAMQKESVHPKTTEA